MSVADQVIQVIDALFDKFGIAVNLTQENLTPIIKEMIGRYALSEIYTKIPWLILYVTGIGFCLFYLFKKASKIVDKDDKLAVHCLFIFFIGILLLCIISAINSIIRLTVFPEKEFLNWLERFIRTLN